MPMGDVNMDKESSPESGSDSSAPTLTSAVMDLLTYQTWTSLRKPSRSLAS